MKPKPRFRKGEQCFDLNGNPGRILAVEWSYGYSFVQGDGNFEFLAPDEVFGTPAELDRRNKQLRKKFADAESAIA